MSDSEPEAGCERKNECEAFKPGRGKGLNFRPKSVPELENGNVKRRGRRPKRSFKDKNKSGSGGCHKIQENNNAAMQSEDKDAIPIPAEVQQQIPVASSVTGKRDDDEDLSVELPYNHIERDEQMNEPLSELRSPAATASNGHGSKTLITSTGTGKVLGKKGSRKHVDSPKTKISQFPQPIRKQLRQYISLLKQRHQKEVAHVKKKQWCWTCEKRSIFHCCWNTSYCSKECQKIHWTEHKYKCTRE